MATDRGINIGMEPNLNKMEQQEKEGIKTTTTTIEWELIHTGNLYFGSYSG